MGITNIELRLGNLQKKMHVPNEYTIVFTKCSDGNYRTGDNNFASEAVKIYRNERDWRDGMFHYIEALDKAIILSNNGELNEKPVLELTAEQVQACSLAFRGGPIVIEIEDAQGSEKHAN